MTKNKLCCRIFPLILISISTLISLAIWYFDEGVHRFTFIENRGEILNFSGTVLFVSIIPIGIFYHFNDKKKYQSNARAFSLFGFLPALVVLVYIIF